jgi:hypothetical protein
MHTHFSGDVGQHLVAIFKLDAEHGVGERFYNRSFKHNGVFLRLRQLVLLRTKVHARRRPEDVRVTARGRREILARLGRLRNAIQFGGGSGSVPLVNRCKTRFEDAVGSL